MCEIVSLSNAAADPVTNSRLYAESGVPFYWIADPAERTLEEASSTTRWWSEVTP